MQWNTLPTILAAFLAAGPVVVVRTAAAPPSTTCTAAERSAQAGADMAITTRIQARLMARGDISSPDIDVSTTNGVVKLFGILDTPVQVRKSVAVAKTVAGVRVVDASALVSRE